MARSTAISLIANRQVASLQRWIVVGNAGSNRIALLNEALSAHGLPPALLVSWRDLIHGHVSLADVVQPGDVLRLESPGRDFATETALLAFGAEAAEAEPYARLSADTARALPYRKGEMLYPRQWYHGLARVLGCIREQTAAIGGLCLLNAPEDTALLFDKPACQARLQECGVPVPRALGVLDPAHGYEDLLGRMTRAGVRRVFAKLAHGSSAAGVIAYRIDAAGGRHQAITTVETEEAEGAVRLFNTRRVRTLTEPREIARVVDALAQHRVYVEEWLPKASLGEGTFDVRALVIAGRLRQVVGRISRSPMTNLHLLNDRADAETVRAHVGTKAWEALETTAIHATQAVAPHSLHVGLDVLWTPGFRRLAVLEANAFGDLLPGALSEGLSTYAAEVQAVSANFPAAGVYGSEC